jgi:hypothetical protein
MLWIMGWTLPNFAAALLTKIKLVGQGCRNNAAAIEPYQEQNRYKSGANQ